MILLSILVKISPLFTGTIFLSCLLENSAHKFYSSYCFNIKVFDNFYQDIFVAVIVADNDNRKDGLMLQILIKTKLN